MTFILGLSFISSLGYLLICHVVFHVCLRKHTEKKISKIPFFILSTTIGLFITLPFAFEVIQFTKSQQGQLDIFKLMLTLYAYGFSLIIVMFQYFFKEKHISALGDLIMDNFKGIIAIVLMFIVWVILGSIVTLRIAFLMP